MAMDYAAAVNEELRDMKASGVDVVQLDEPWVRTAPDKAERYGVRGRSIARWRGSPARPSCICASATRAMVRDKPSGYAFLPQLADTAARQISIEAAQPKIDLGVLADLSGKQIMLGRAGPGQRRRGDRRDGGRAASAPGLRHVAAERLGRRRRIAA